MLGGIGANVTCRDARASAGARTKRPALRERPETLESWFSFGVAVKAERAEPRSRSPVASSRQARPDRQAVPALKWYSEENGHLTVTLLPDVVVYWTLFTAPVAVS